MSLKEITDHIYGRINVIARTDRPNMFIKELKIYLEYLNNKIDEARESMSGKQEKYLATFVSNLHQGISYYQQLFSEVKDRFNDTRTTILQELEVSRQALQDLHYRIEKLALSPAIA